MDTTLDRLQKAEKLLAETLIPLHLPGYPPAEDWAHLEARHRLGDRIRAFLSVLPERKTGEGKIGVQEGASVPLRKIED